MHSPAVCKLRRIALAALLSGVAMIANRHSPVAHAATTSNVAYVYDNPSFALNSTTISPFMAMTGHPPGTGDRATYNGLNFTNVQVSAIDTGGEAALTNYDTVLLYEVCDIGQHPAAMSAINRFLSDGGKVMIFDADWCAARTFNAPDYSTFLYPFTTSNPGALGATGSYTSVESSPLTTGLSMGTQAGDSMGDANTFTTFNGAWCGAITGTSNTNTGIVMAYARTSRGGLVIYEGEDYGATNGSDEYPHLQLVFNNMLAQPYNPDGLPCTHRASGISLDPATSSPALGTTETLTATVADSAGTPQANVTVSFKVLSGPDSGQTGSGVTDGAGQASFNLSDTTTPGTDVVGASFIDAGGTHTSNDASVTWTGSDTTPPVVTITSQPPSSTSSDSASIAFTVSDPDDALSSLTISCQLDSAAVTAGCTSPQAFAGLAIGSHTFQVTATDPAGNTGTAGATWTITSAPAATTVIIQTGAGWNMVGGSPLTLWSDAVPPLWSLDPFTDQWFQPNGTEPAGTGAWEDVPTAGPRSVTVIPCGSAITVPVTAYRWNLVGNPCNSRVTLPDTARAFWWDPVALHYVPVSSINAGAAAWVKPDGNALTLTPAVPAAAPGHTLARQAGARQTGHAIDLPPIPRAGHPRHTHPHQPAHEVDEKNGSDHRLLFRHTAGNLRGNKLGIPGR